MTDFTQRLEAAAMYGAVPNTSPNTSSNTSSMLPTSRSVTILHLFLDLLDKLGARLQFERSGVRLSLALLAKHDQRGSFAGGPGRSELLGILEEKRAHFELLWSAIENLGADPAVMTPSTAFRAVVARGAGNVLLDPSSTLLEALRAALVVEVGDDEGWLLLRRLAEAVGLRTLSERCEQARLREHEHLQLVRNWLAAGQGRTPRQARRLVEGVARTQRDDRPGVLPGRPTSAAARPSGSSCR